VSVVIASLPYASAAGFLIFSPLLWSMRQSVLLSTQLAALPLPCERHTGTPPPLENPPLTSAPAAQDELLFQLHRAARYCDWMVYQPLRVWLARVKHESQICNTTLTHTSDVSSQWLSLLFSDKPPCGLRESPVPGIPWLDIFSQRRFAQTYSPCFKL
jgi:hypothetical protein